MKLYYARVSTEEQNEERQIKLAKELGINTEEIYIDKKSGKNTDREEFKKLMSFARKGDIIYTESISRIARNTKDLLNIIDDLSNRNIDFVSVKENLDTQTPQGKFMLTIFGALSEFEREQLLQRQAEGIEIAKAKGKYKGRKPKEINEEQFKKVVARWKAKEITAVHAMEELNLKPNTFYRRVKEIDVR